MKRSVLKRYLNEEISKEELQVLSGPQLSLIPASDVCVSPLQAHHITTFCDNPVSIRQPADIHLREKARFYAQPLSASAPHQSTSQGVHSTDQILLPSTAHLHNLRDAYREASQVRSPPARSFPQSLLPCSFESPSSFVINSLQESFQAPTSEDQQRTAELSENAKYFSGNFLTQLSSDLDFADPDLSDSSLHQTYLSSFPSSPIDFKCPPDCTHLHRSCSLLASSLFNLDSIYLNDYKDANITSSSNNNDYNWNSSQSNIYLNSTTSSSSNICDIYNSTSALSSPVSHQYSQDSSETAGLACGKLPSFRSVFNVEQLDVKMETDDSASVNEEQCLTELTPITLEMDLCKDANLPLLSDMSDMADILDTSDRWLIDSDGAYSSHLAAVKVESVEDSFEDISYLTALCPQSPGFQSGPEVDSGPEGESEGYESSGTENSSRRRSFQEQAYSHHTIDHPLSYSLHSVPVPLHPASRQPSPISDEGFVDGPNVSEDHLPNFEKIQNPLSDAEQSPSGKRSPTSLRGKKSPTFDKERRKPGRKPGHVSNILHLWEFMRDLLRDPSSNNNIVQWVSRAEGVFKVVNSTEVARLWGEKKNNKKQMTYEKLSRSLRYSRLEGYFSSLPKDKNYPKKLCFKFGPKSKDWH